MSSEATARYALKRIYDGIKDDSDFLSFDDFLEWADGKYKSRYAIYKMANYKPHSKSNSYWYKYKCDLPDVISPICEECGQKFYICGTIGCMRYREWYVQNWNENICSKTKEPKQPKQTRKRGKEYFQYEHPDLVREGIVWSGN